MGKYQYIAIDPAGRERKGTLKAADGETAQAQLSAKNWHILSINAAQQAVANNKDAPRSFGRRQRLNNKQLMLFTRQLASLMQVSPLEESLGTISRQSENIAVRHVLGEVHNGVVEGQTLADAMRRETRSFPPIYRAMVSAGESSGSLPAISERLADLMEKQSAIRGKIITALAYPAILALVALLVVVGLMVSVVPRIVEQFDSSKTDLPPITEVVIAISDILAGYWWLILGVIALAAIGLLIGLRNPDFRYRFDGMLLRIPFIGRLIRDVHAARLARTLATMVASRLPLLDGIQLTAKTVRNTVLRRSMDEIVERIRGGGSLSGALKNAGHFPPLLVYLTASGESSGQLDTMLERAADYLEREFENFTSTVLSLLEPAIIVIMGGLVAVIILSILLPILQLQDLTGF